jgi:hypothetical protein
MRMLILVVLLGAGVSLGAQSLVEYSGAAAAGSAGGASGKKISDGVSGIFNKVDKAAAKAAGADTHGDKAKSAPVLDVGPGVPHPRAASSAGPETDSAASPKASARAEAGSVPPPPPAARKSVARKPAPQPEPEPPPVVEPPPPPPPPAVATAADLKTVAPGTNREDLLKLGAPATRITMYEDGHLVEIFHYMSQDASIGVVRLSDGAVASVHVN